MRSANRTSRRRLFLLLLLLGGLLLFVAVGPRVMPYFIWKWNESAIDPESPLFGTMFSQDLKEAVYFFYATTGIEPENVEMSHFGFLWKLDTVKDLEAWRGWYQKNHHRLYWDIFNGDLEIHN